ncbi:MAG: DinB family protein [Planctomycetota bacterium]
MTGNLLLNERPQPNEHAPYFSRYIELVPARPLAQLFHEQLEEVREFCSGVSEERAAIVDSPYRWTFKQVLGHMLDTERVFGYRANRVAAGDQNWLPGFVDNARVAGLDYRDVTLASLVEELLYLRFSNSYLFDRLNAEQLARIGVADGKPISARACAYVLVGHVEHHLRILRQRLADHPE